MADRLVVGFVQVELLGELTVQVIDGFDVFKIRHRVLLRILR